MKDQIIFFTGATSGLGKVAACELANNGSIIIATCRNEEKSNELQQYFKHNYPTAKGKFDFIICDLCSFESIKEACNSIKKKYHKLDMIINNAGVMNFSFVKTQNDIEETLQVNLLSPLLITHLLIELLSKSSTAKLIFTASGLHQGNIMFNDLEFKNSFSSFRAYRQSKLGIILICRLLHEKLSNYNIGVYCQHPGMVKTNLGRSAGWFSNLIFSMMSKSAEKGAQTLLFLANTPKDELVSGEYYANQKVTKTTNESYDLSTAGKLLTVVKHYLSNYINENSLIFENDK